MTNNDPQQVAREALNNKKDSPPPSSGGNGGGEGNPLPIVIGVAVLAIALIGVGLYMLFGGFGDSDETVAEEAAPAAEETAAEETAAEETAAQPESTANVAVLPSGAAPRGEVVMLNGNNVPVSGGVQPSDDLYLWNGNEWVFVPSVVSGDGQSLMTVDQLEGSEVIVAQRPAPESLIIAAEAHPETALAPEVLNGMGEVSSSGLLLGAGGELTGSSAAVPAGAYQQLLHVTNAAVIVDQTALNDILANADTRSLHIQSLVNAASAGGYTGINLDYQGAIANQKDQFTQFVQELKTALDGQGLSLVVTLATPTNNNGTWESGGQDWARIGEIADGVYAQLPLDPTAYVDNGQADQVLIWATHQVDRAKLTALVSGNAIDRLGSTYSEIPMEFALFSMGQLATADGTNMADPSTAVDFVLQGNATPLTWDGASLTYQFTLDKDGQTRTIWLSNESALAYRLRLARKYNVRGVAITGLGDLSNPQSYASAINGVMTAGEIPQPNGAAITWSVANAEGGVVASNSGETSAYSWPGAEAEGEYTAAAQFAQGDMTFEFGQVPLTIGNTEVAMAEGEGDAQAAEGETATEEAAPTEEAATSEEAPATEEAAATEETPAAEETAATTEEAPAAEETATTEETTDTTDNSGGDDGTAESGPVVETPDGTGTPNGRVNTASNLRAGPGIIYARVGDGADPDTQVEVVGRSNDSLWYQIIMPDNTGAWIYAQLVDTQVDVAGLPVPAVAASPSSGGTTTTDGGGTTAPAAAPVAAPSAPAGFALGGQTHTLANPTLMQYSGMTWVKFQHKWGCGNNPGDLQGRIDSAKANGMKVLLSIPGSPYPSSIDFECYTDFLGGVAALGPDAIEVWNEMNIDFEWPVGSIDPSSYVNNMLIPAYNKIKAANPNVMVISGAPAPTGFFGGGCAANGCDDNAYLAGMAAAGAASYMDCMGVHYNAGATAPNTVSGHPADGGAGHYSWYMQPMIDTYYNALGRPLCFTELGYLTSHGYGSLPSNFSWAGGTTIDQHAQWLAQAVSIAANSGKVSMVIIFNIDFTLYDGSDPQAGYGMVRRDGSCPACETVRAVMQ